MFTVECQTFFVLRFYLKDEFLGTGVGGYAGIQELAADALALGAGQYVQASNAYDFVAWSACCQKPDDSALVVFGDMEKDPVILYLSGQRFRAVP